MNSTFATISHRPIWRSEPDGRGSWSILTSSLITIALCAYSALHLNVPEHGCKYIWPRKMKWLLLGLLAPEVVAYIAWSQRLEASRLLRSLNGKRQSSETQAWLSYIRRPFRRHKDPEKDSALSSPTSNWTLTHTFYALMGGFAISPSTHASPFLPASITRLTLSTKGLRFILEHAPSLIPRITEAEIEDKSKADGLKKFLVCAQATWFIGASIARLAKSLPITLLELNAVAHALCALLIYLFWWSKPLDIFEPTLILTDKDDQTSDQILAYLFMSSHLSVTAARYKGHDIARGLRNEFLAIWPFDNSHLPSLIFPRQPDCYVIRPALTTATILDYSHISRHMLGDAGFSSIHLAILRCVQQSKYAHILPLRLRFPPGFGTRETLITHLSPTTLSRWSLAHAAIIRFRLLPTLRQSHAAPSSPFFYMLPSSLATNAEYVTTRIRNHASLLPTSDTVIIPPHPSVRPTSNDINNSTEMQNASQDSGWAIWLGFMIAGCSYGGLHCLAWNAEFVSRATKIIWRLSASSVVAVPFLVMPFFLWRSLAQWQGRRRGGYLKGKRTWPSGVRKIEKTKVVGREVVGKLLHGSFMAVVGVLGVFSPLLLGAYVFGRGALIGECFVQLAFLGDGAFETVNWPGYVPHIA